MGLLALLPPCLPAPLAPGIELIECCLRAPGGMGDGLGDSVVAL